MSRPIRRARLLLAPVLLVACSATAPNTSTGGGGGATAGAGGSGGTAADGATPTATGGTSGDSGQPPGSRPLAIAPQELATRLAKFLWGAAADAALVQRAAGVKNREDVGPLGLEMLKDQRAR